MIELFILCLINAFVIIGFHESTAYQQGLKGYSLDDSNLLGFIAYWGDKILPWFFTKPLWNCPLCMSSLWSVWYWVFPRNHDWIEYIFYIFALAGIVHILCVIWEIKERKKNKTV